MIEEVRKVLEDDVEEIRGQANRMKQIRQEKMKKEKKTKNEKKRNKMKIQIRKQTNTKTNKEQTDALRREYAREERKRNNGTLKTLLDQHTTAMLNNSPFMIFVCHFFITRHTHTRTKKH